MRGVTEREKAGHRGELAKGKVLLSSMGWEFPAEWRGWPEGKKQKPGPPGDKWGFEEVWPRRGGGRGGRREAWDQREGLSDFLMENFVS